MGELRILAAALRAITFRPIANDVGFTAMNTSSYGALVFGLLFATLAEMIAVHLGLSYYLGDGYPVVHVGVLLLHGYAIGWILGDWRLMKESGHTVVDRTLHIHLGERWQGAVPLENIAEVRQGEVDPPDFLRGEKRPEHVVAVTPFDAPNLTVIVTEPVTLKTYFGFSRTGTELQLFVDNPSDVCDALSRAL